MIAIVDAGLGNLRSVEKALAQVAKQPVALIADPEAIARADRLVVPGQGAFGDSARALRPDAPLGQAVLAHARSGRPYLGICLGLQLLFASSEEAPGEPGLAIFDGPVRRLPADAFEDGHPCKLPNIGWCPVRPHAERDALDRALAGWFYFVHSYAAAPTDETLIAATAPFGGHAITAAVRRDNVLAVQFHPEKSQAQGLALLEAFCEWRP